MSTLALKHRQFTAEEYLIIERKAAFKSEYLDGEIYAMAGASPTHTTITDNLTGEVHTQLKGTPCQGMSQDMKVTFGENGLFAYPDFLIVCGEKRYYVGEQDVLLNPVVLVEVLSPTTEQYDRTTKFDRYKQIPSLRDYVLVTQNSARVEHYSLNTNGDWIQQTLVGLNATLTLSGVRITLKLADIYDRVDFPANPAQPSS